LRALHDGVTDFVEDELGDGVVGVELGVAGDVQPLAVPMHIGVAAAHGWNAQARGRIEPDAIQIAHRRQDYGQRSRQAMTVSERAGVPQVAMSSRLASSLQPAPTST